MADEDDPNRPAPPPAGPQDDEHEAPEGAREPFEATAELSAEDVGVEEADLEAPAADAPATAEPPAAEEPLPDIAPVVSEPVEAPLTIAEAPASEEPAIEVATEAENDAPQAEVVEAARGPLEPALRAFESIVDRAVSGPVAPDATPIEALDAAEDPTSAALDEDADPQAETEPTAETELEDATPNSAVDEIEPEAVASLYDASAPAPEPPAAEPESAAPLALEAAPQRAEDVRAASEEATITADDAAAEAEPEAPVVIEPEPSLAAAVEEAEPSDAASESAKEPAALAGSQEETPTNEDLVELEAVEAAETPAPQYAAPAEEALADSTDAVASMLDSDANIGAVETVEDEPAEAPLADLAPAAEPEFVAAESEETGAELGEATDELTAADAVVDDDAEHSPQQATIDEAAEPEPADAPLARITAEDSPEARAEDVAALSAAPEINYDADTKAEAQNYGSFEHGEESAASSDPDDVADGFAPVAESAEAPAEQLPENYFRAAGDPDEPDGPPPTFWQRQGQTLSRSLRGLSDGFERSFVAFSGGLRGFFGAVGKGANNIKRPRNVREAAIWGGWAVAAGVALLVAFFFVITWDMPSTDDLWEARNGQSITFLDRRGNVILREGAQNAPPVDLDSLPPYVAQAFIAIEDKRFYQHWGVDIGGMMRAGAQNLRAGRVVQGGSTLTQQLAKNLFLTNERSWRRKAQEIAMAIWLERRFTKREILALYLSRVYFGAGAYGIEAAAERYFDRPARELTLLQSAMIAGLVKAPSRLNPASQDINAARERAELVLAEMVSMGFISEAERAAAMQEELLVSRKNPAGVLAYYRDWIDPLLNDVIGTQLDDFIIETTIDVQSQRAAAEAVETVLAEQGESRHVGQAALLSMDDQGGVIAMVGGRDYDQSQFNRATQARRQPGSAFKFFIYLAAMESGLTPWTVREDAPITIRIPGQPDWTPGNYKDQYYGPSELVRAFAASFNMVAIRVAHEIGGDHIIEVARRLGVTAELHNYHSLSLGAQEVTLLEMTQAYGAMASEGYRVEAHGVTRIRRANSDETMWSWRPEHGRQRVIEERPLRYMNYMMSRVVQAGTGTRVRMENRQIGGKTGTGNDYRDAWFIGFTPGIVTGVWAGNDNFSETARVTGGSLPADIWARFMPTPLRNVPARDLQMPRPEDYDVGPAAIGQMPNVSVVGAPLSAAGSSTAATPDDSQDRSLDFGPEG